MFTKNHALVAAGIAAVVVIGGGTTYAATAHHTAPAKVSKATKSTAAEKTHKQSNGMDLNAIKSGDFSSIAGTWKNSNGDTYVFDDNGLKAAIFDGVKTTDQEVVTKAEGHVPAAAMRDGLLQANLINKDHKYEGANPVVPLSFIPKGVNLPGTSNPDADRLYLGEALQGDDHVFQKTIESKETKEMENLPLKEKQALALLGMPAGFQTDYGETTPDMLLAGKAKPVRKVNGHLQPYDSTFKGVKLMREQEKYVVLLQNIPADVYNQSSVRGVIDIDGDTIVYKTEAVVAQDQGKDETVMDQTTGKSSMYDLYKQYKGTKKLKQMEKLILDN